MLAQIMLNMHPKQKLKVGEHDHCQLNRNSSWLRCGLLGPDIGKRFGMQAQYLRIEATWLRLLYHRLRAFPIWASCVYTKHISTNHKKKLFKTKLSETNCLDLFAHIKIA
jgi:hypothetical protein